MYCVHKDNGKRIKRPTLTLRSQSEGCGCVSGGGGGDSTIDQNARKFLGNSCGMAFMRIYIDCYENGKSMCSSTATRALLRPHQLTLRA